MNTINKYIYALGACMLMISGKAQAMSEAQATFFAERAAKFDEPAREDALRMSIDHDRDDLVQVITGCCAASTAKDAFRYAALTRSEKSTKLLARMRIQPHDLIIELATTPAGSRMINVILTASPLEQTSIDQLLLAFCQVLPYINDNDSFTSILGHNPSQAAIDAALRTIATFTDAGSNCLTCSEEKIIECAHLLLDKGVSPEARQDARRIATQAGMESVARYL